MTKIASTASPTAEQKDAILRLWNNEYPQQLQYADMAGLDTYLANLHNQCHYFAVDESDAITGWAFSFDRDNEKWFAVIVDSLVQRKGVGSLLLGALKQEENLLNGWVTDHCRYLKADGTTYLSPMQFYLKNGFTVCAGVRLEVEKLSAVKIQWSAVN